MRARAISLPYTQKATRLLTEACQKNPQAEVPHLLQRMGISRGQLISEISRELLVSVSNLAIEVVEVDISLVNEKTGPIIDLLSMFSPSNYKICQEILCRALRTYHPETFSHSIRVEQSAMKMVNIFGLEGCERKTLSLASQFHDIGKTTIPLAILDKPEGLKAKEKKVMRLHQSIGYLMLRGLECFRQVAEIMAFTHIEQGYPEEIVGREVSFLSHILIVADIFDACFSSRGYRANHGLPLRDVFEIVAQHENPRHPLEILIAAARAYEINFADATSILGSVFTSGDEVGQIEEAFG